jgi:DNA-binding beta-propeller fold protein YncE
MRHRSLRRAGILAVVLLAALLPVLGSAAVQAACLPVFGRCLPSPSNPGLTTPTTNTPVYTPPVYAPPASGAPAYTPPASSSPVHMPPAISGPASNAAAASTHCGKPTPGSHKGRCAQASSRAVPHQVTQGQVQITGPSAGQVSVSQIITLDPNAYPSGSAYSAATHKLFVASNDTTLQTLFVIDTTTNAVTRIVDPSFCYSAGVAVDDTTGLAYVANQDAFEGCGGAMNTVTVVNIASNSVVQVIPISAAPLYPTRITIPSGLSKVFVGENTSPDNGPNADIVVLDRGGSHAVIDRITNPAIQGIVGMASNSAQGTFGFASSGTQVYATNNKNGDAIGNTLIAIDGTSDSVLSSIPVGTSPGVDVDAAGNVYVALGVDFFAPGVVDIVSPFSLAVTRTIPVTSGPFDGLLAVAVSSSSNPLFALVGLGGTVYTDSPQCDSLYLINPSSGTVQATVSFAGAGACNNVVNPTSIALVPGGYAYVNLAYTGQVAVVHNYGGF